MDPPLLSESSFSAANPSAYSLAEIWPFGPDHQLASAEESTVTDLSGAAARVRKRRDLSSEDESSKLVSSSTATQLSNSKVKRSKLEEPKFENGSTKLAEVEGSSVAGEQASKPLEPPKLDFIHVRARRGQATDSHSLAERARREKISERMKTLQDLVPGCNKIIGKALVLDEIINYIQSLQGQVEFLSMKLETVNSRANLSPAMEGFSSKELDVQPFDTTGVLFGSQAPREYDQALHPEWLHMQVGGNFERPT